MTLDELVVMQARMAQAVERLVKMRAHVEPVEAGWRVLAVSTSDDKPLVAVDSFRKDLLGLVECVDEAWRSWCALGRRPS